LWSDSELIIDNANRALEKINHNKALRARMPPWLQRNFEESIFILGTLHIDFHETRHQFEFHP